MVTETPVTNKSIIAPYVLNNYVWQLLKNNDLGMTEANYGNRIPIVPSGQEPDLTVYNKPFLVYGYSEDSTPDLYANRGGSLSYAVWSTNVGEINSVLNTIRTAMERQDESAREINAYTSTPAVFNVYGRVSFRNIHIGYFEGPSPEETEGGRKAGFITLRYEYVADYKVKTFDGVGWS